MHVSTQACAHMHTHKHTHTHTHTHTHLSHYNINRGDTKKYFMQAMSPAEMKEWLEVMENQEPVS